MSAWDSLLETVKGIAPAIVTAAGTAVGGPAAGALAGSIARSILGPDAKGKSLDEVASDILADPDKMLQFRLKIREAELQELEIRTKDTADARKAHTLSKGAIALSILIVLSFCSLIFVVTFVPIPTGSQNVAYLLIGVLGAEFAKVSNFFLGSSVGSKEKTQIMDSFMKAAKLDQVARRSNG